jgi:hypothetical protein
MFTEVLNGNQRELLPLIKKFSKTFYLVGGTAIALQTGHRRSIDFDLFTNEPIDKLKIKPHFQPPYIIQKVLWEDKDQMHLIVNDVKITFFRYPYVIPAAVDFQHCIKMPHLLDLAAMKALALGGRAKWKDYVDLFFLLKDHFSLLEVSAKARQLFEGSFNPKLFREQLSYYKDVDYSEEVEFMPGFKVAPQDIELFLTETALQEF